MHNFPLVPPQSPISRPTWVPGQPENVYFFKKKLKFPMEILASLLKYSIKWGSWKTCRTAVISKWLRVGYHVQGPAFDLEHPKKQKQKACKCITWEKLSLILIFIFGMWQEAVYTDRIVPFVQSMGWCVSGEKQASGDDLALLLSNWPMAGCFSASCSSSIKHRQ